MDANTIKTKFEYTLNFAKVFGTDEEDCCSNLEIAYNTMYNGAEQSEESLSFEQTREEYIIGLVGCCVDYANDENLKKVVKDLYEMLNDFLLNDSALESYEENSKFSEELTDYVTEDLVSDNVKVLAVVALLLDDRAVAYRFKTNEGYFDITRKVAIQYGINGFKIEKAIRLQRLNGMLLTQSEINNRCCIPDVSYSANDCKRLADAMFR